MAMARTGLGAVFAASFLFTVGCGGNPLEGTWSISATNQGFTSKEIVDLKSDATASASYKFTKTPAGITCKGSIDYSGYDWSSTETNITVSGSSSCKSSLVCMAVGQSLPFGCAPMNNIAGTCHYKLSSDEQSFDLSDCSNQAIDGDTFTRED